MLQAGIHPAVEGEILIEKGLFFRGHAPLLNHAENFGGGSFGHTVAAFMIAREGNVHRVIVKISGDDGCGIFGVNALHLSILQL